MSTRSSLLLRLIASIGRTLRGEDAPERHDGDDCCCGLCAVADRSQVIDLSDLHPLHARQVRLGIEDSFTGRWGSA